jgi:hypothetical protein
MSRRIRQLRASLSFLLLFDKTNATSTVTEILEYCTVQNRVCCYAVEIRGMMCQ